VAGPGLLATLVVGALLVLSGGLWAVLHYNRLVALATQVREAWSDIEVQLRRRYDLIPNLADTVRAHAAQERATIEAALRARDAALADTGEPEHQAATERVREGRLARLVAVAEALPELRADEAFRALAIALTDAETRLKRARRFYNGSVKALNVAVGQFPGNLVARACGIGPAQYFELDDAPGVGRAA
jgi:LemA protein